MANNGTVIAAGFEIFNVAVLFLGMIFVAYTSVMGVINTAHDGEFLGRKMSNIWVPLRTFAGSALLLPLAGGYSAIQVVVMWLAVQGVGIGDKVWAAMLTRVDQGGMIGHPHIPDARPLAANIFKFEICRAAMNKQFAESDRNDRVVVQPKQRFIQAWVPTDEVLTAVPPAIGAITNTGYKPVQIQVTSWYVKLMADDLFGTPLNQAEIDFENEGGETYICGNPPYLGNKLQSEEQKSDLAAVFDGRLEGWKSLDYVAAWLMKAADYGLKTSAASAFVATNSICQGQQVPILWPSIFASGHAIDFAYTSFKWSNLASNNAGVIVIIVGISNVTGRRKRLYIHDADDAVLERLCSNINPYLVDGQNMVVEAKREPPSERAPMLFGNMPRDGGHLIASYEDKITEAPEDEIFGKFLKRFVGSEDFIQGKLRYCLWIEQDQWNEAARSPAIARRLDAVKSMRLASKAGSTRDYAKAPYRFVQIQGKAKQFALIVPRHSSERRPYLPVGLLDATTIVADSAFALYDAPLWSLAMIASRLHLVWIAAVCGKLKTDYRYSNTLGWNTFPVPTLTDKNRLDLTRCAEDILAAREVHFPATIADLYDPESMPANLRQAHERNDEVLERIYIGRRFRNDTERLEKLFAMYAGGQKGIPSNSNVTTLSGTRTRA